MKNILDIILLLIYMTSCFMSLSDWQNVQRAGFIMFAISGLILGIRFYVENKREERKREWELRREINAKRHDTSWY